METKPKGVWVDVTKKKPYKEFEIRAKEIDEQIGEPKKIEYS